MSAAKVAKTEEVSKETWEKLWKIEEKLDSLDSAMREEEFKLIAKYDALKVPTFEERQSIISEIPNFWANAIDHHPVLANQISSEADSLLVERIKSISVDKSKPNTKVITMEFTENPIFTNKTLTKTLTVVNEEITCSKDKINWRNGQNPKNAKKRDPCSSFFEWFENDESEIGEIIADDLFPNAVKYYAGISESDEEDDESFDEDEDEE